MGWAFYRIGRGVACISMCRYACVCVYSSPSFCMVLCCSQWWPENIKMEILEINISCFKMCAILNWVMNSLAVPLHPSSSTSIITSSRVSTLCCVGADLLVTGHHLGSQTTVAVSQ